MEDLWLSHCADLSTRQDFPAATQTLIFSRVTYKGDKLNSSCCETFFCNTFIISQMTRRKENRREPPEIRIWTDDLHVWRIRQQLHSSEGGISDRPIELMMLSLINWWCAAWRQRYQLGETEGHVFGLTVIRSFGLMSSKKKEKERKKREFLWGLWGVKKVTHAVCRDWRNYGGKKQYS